MYKKAFVTPFGKWQFNMVPFSLAQAPAYFQALISMVEKIKVQLYENAHQIFRPSHFRKGHRANAG